MKLLDPSWYLSWHATLGSVKYTTNLTDTIEANNQHEILLNKDIQIIFDKYALDRGRVCKRDPFNVNAQGNGSHCLL